MRFLVCSIACLVASAAFAQSDNIPAGGCMPIGLTARGELVFPMQCQELLVKQRGPIGPDKPDDRTGSIDAQTAAAPAVAKPPEAATADQLRKPAAEQRRADRRRRKRGADATPQAPTPTPPATTAPAAAPATDVTGSVKPR